MAMLLAGGGVLTSGPLDRQGARGRDADRGSRRGARSPRSTRDAAPAGIPRRETPDCGQSRAGMSLRDAARLVCHRPTWTEWRHPNNLCSRGQVPVALRGAANRWPHQIPETPAFRDEPLGAAAEPGVALWPGPSSRTSRWVSRSLWRDRRSRRAGRKPPAKLAFFAAQQSSMIQVSMVLARLGCLTAHGRRQSTRGHGSPAARSRAGLGGPGVRLDRSPPASVAPRQIPPATRRQGRRHQIKAARPQRMAAAQSRQGDPAAGPQSKSSDRLVGVIRTGRQVSTMHANER